jgi:transcription elongation factor Elf1
MNYKTLKWMLESLIKVYKCPMCNAEVSESYVDIVWAAWNTVNIDIECQNCKKHSMIKAEINSVNILPINVWENWMDWLKKSLENIKWQITQNNNQISNSKKITDTEIVDLNKRLKNDDLNAQDLFNQ